MSYLKGEQIKIDTPTIKKMIGKKVIYLLEKDIDKSGRGYFSPRTGTITEVYRKHIDFGNGDFIYFSQVKEIVIK